MGRKSNLKRTFSIQSCPMDGCPYPSRPCRKCQFMPQSFSTCQNECSNCFISCPTLLNQLQEFAKDSFNDLCKTDWLEEKHWNLLLNFLKSKFPHYELFSTVLIDETGEGSALIICGHVVIFSDCARSLNSIDIPEYLYQSIIEMHHRLTYCEELELDENTILVFNRVRNGVGDGNTD